MSWCCTCPPRRLGVVVVTLPVSSLLLYVTCGAAFELLLCHPRSSQSVHHAGVHRRSPRLRGSSSRSPEIDQARRAPGCVSPRVCHVRCCITPRLRSFFPLWRPSSFPHVRPRLSASLRYWAPVRLVSARSPFQLSGGPGHCFLVSLPRALLSLSLKPLTRGLCAETGSPQSWCSLPSGEAWMCSHFCLPRNR